MEDPTFAGDCWSQWNIAAFNQDRCLLWVISCRNGRSLARLLYPNNGLDAAPAMK